MADRFNPLVSIDKFRYADSSRTQKRREPGSCPTLLNLSPSQGEGERIRRGYAAYSTIVPPSGMQKFFILPIQTPSQEDVFLWMADNGGQVIYQNPYWNGSGTKLSTNVQINESKSFTGVAGSFPTAKQMTITGSDALGLSQTANYYKGWEIVNNSQLWLSGAGGSGQECAFITAYTYSSAASGTSTFTFAEDVDGTGLSWVVTNSYSLYRNNHSNPTFSPTYNNNYTSPPFAMADISRLYFSGGQSSATGNAAMISQYESKTFFPTIGARSYAMTQTYVSEERCKAMAKSDLVVYTGTAGKIVDSTPLSGASAGLDAGKTYWVAISPIYDGYQIGELTKFETVASDYNMANVSGWTSSQNYLATADALGNAIVVSFGIKLGSLDKRITGFSIWVAVDTGNTRSIGRQSEFQHAADVSIVSSNAADLPLWGSWSYSSSYGVFSYTATIDKLTINALGSTYIDASGMEESPPDTSYSYSSRLVLNDKHYLSNVYISSEAVTNREEIFTNPRGGLAGVNSGINQPSLFPNDQGFFRKGIELAIGTKINCMAKVGLGELLTVKDRGVILNRIIEESDGTIQLVSQILDQNIGCSTLNGFTQLDADEGGLIFFAGYDDIYLYDNARFKRLIEREDQQDWLYQYRVGISKASKESTVMAYMPEGILLLDISPTSYLNGQQFQMYSQYLPDGWRQVAFKQTSGFASTNWFVQFGKLQDGTVIGAGSDSGGTLTLYQFSVPSTGVYYYTDAGTTIRYQLDTGDLVTSGDVAKDTWLDRYQIARYADSPTTGTLDCKIYKDGTILRTLSSMDKTSQYLKASVRSDDPKIGNYWRLAINTNTSTPEVMAAGNDFRIQGIRIFGHSKIRQRISDAGYLTTGLGDCVPNTIAGEEEIYVDEANTTYTWDVPFTQTYVDLDGATVPKYRFLVESANADGTQLLNEEIIIVSKTLTTITLRSSTNHTKCKFRASEG